MDSVQIATTSPQDDQNPSMENIIDTDDLRANPEVNESDNADTESVASDGSDDSQMEPFEDYKSKIEQLLGDLALGGFSIDEIQHGYTYQNCVYALASLDKPDEQYVLRVPVLPEYRESDDKCIAIENDAALLGYIGNKLPVPRVKAYDTTNDNALGRPFTIQTRIPGISLDNIYDDLTHEEKLAIADQFVELLVKIQSVTFDTAGTFVADPPLPAAASDFFTAFPAVKVFDEGPESFVQDPQTVRDRQGLDLKALLISHVNGWIQEESGKERSFSLSSLHRLLKMIDTLDQEGVFKGASASPPIVLHHWDLEPRNIMVEKINDAWKICGVIDWDDAIALPRPLALRAPDWIWDFNTEGFTGYLNTDHHPNENLSDEDAALKTHFDQKAAAALERYLEDAYGRGRWLRRIWTFARGGVSSMWYIDLVKNLEEDWDARPKVEEEHFPSSSSKCFLEKALNWVLGLEVAVRKWL